jgi:hypothetical protein
MHAQMLTHQATTHINSSTQHRPGRLAAANLQPRPVNKINEPLVLQEFNFFKFN